MAEIVEMIEMLFFIGMKQNNLKTHDPRLRTKHMSGGKNRVRATSNQYQTEAGQTACRTADRNRLQQAT